MAAKELAAGMEMGRLSPESYETKISTIWKLSGEEGAANSSNVR